MEWMDRAEKDYRSVKTEEKALKLLLPKMFTNLWVVLLTLVAYTLAFPFLYGIDWMYVLAPRMFISGFPWILFLVPFDFYRLDNIYGFRYPSLRREVCMGINAAQEAVTRRVRGQRTDHSEELLKANLEAFLAALPSTPPFWYRYHIHVYVRTFALCWMLLLFGLTLFWR